MQRRAKKKRSAEIRDRDRPQRAASQVHGPQHAKAGIQNRYVMAAVCCFLLLAVALVFGQTLGHGFVGYDDQEYVYENPRVQAGISAKNIEAAFTSPHALNWHPLTTISHMLDCQFFGLNPGWHHLVNVVLHAATSLLLFLVLARMTGSLWPSTWVAAVFAIHPLHVESVAWVAERKDVLSGLFFMLTLAAYLRYSRRPFSVARYLTVVACFALGLMSKPMLVTLPFVLLLLDYWPLRRFLLPGGTIVRRSTENPFVPRLLQNTEVPLGKRNLLLVMEKIPLLALSAGSCAMTLWAQGSELESVQTIPLYMRLGNAAIAYVAYLGQTFWPAGLAVLYPHPGVTGSFALDAPWLWKTAGAVVLLLALTAIFFLAGKRQPWLIVGWLWYVGMLVPVIGLVQAGWQSMADRYTYLTQIGILLGIGWTVSGIVSAGPRRRLACGAMSALVIAALMAVAWRQTSYWRNSESLWTRALDCTTRNVIAHTGLGTTFQQQGRLPEAIRQYELALEINPIHLQVHNNLGGLYFQQKRFDDAILQYKAALAASPNYAKAHHNLGSCYYNQNKLDEAIAEFRRSLELKPDYIDARCDLATALCRQGKLEEGAAQWQMALDLQPDNSRAIEALARLRATTAKSAEEIRQKNNGTEK